MEEQARPPTPLIVWLLTGSVVGAYLAYLAAPAEMQRFAEYTFALIPERFNAASQYRFEHWWGAPAALLGHSFLHLSWWHLGFNTFFLFGASRLPALRLGFLRYLLVYFASVLGGAAVFLALNWNDQAIAVGASGGVCSMFTAFFFATRPTWRDALSDPRVRGPLGGLVVLNVLVMGVAAEAGFLPIAWEGHLGGFIGGGVAYASLQPRPRGPWG